MTPGRMDIPGEEESLKIQTDSTLPSGIVSA